MNRQISVCIAEITNVFDRRLQTQAAQMPRETHIGNKAIELSLGCLRFRREVDLRVSWQFSVVLGAPENTNINEVT